MLCQCRKLTKNKRKKGKTLQKRAIHCTPKHITHDYYGSVRAHWTDKRWMVKEAVLRYAPRVHGGNFSFKRCANGSTLSWLTLKRPYWGRRGMTDPSSMLFVIWESKDWIYHQRWHLALFHPPAFKRQAWSSREVKSFYPKAPSGRAGRWSQEERFGWKFSSH